MKRLLLPLLLLAATPGSVSRAGSPTPEARYRFERVALGEADDYKPCIARLPSGELLLTAFHQHQQPGGKVLEQTLLFRSRDDGRSWSAAEKLPLLGREPYLTVLKDGTLFITGHLLAGDVRNKWGYTTGFVHRSTDGGRTWNSVRIESEGVKPGASNHSSRNVLELSDGTLLLGVDCDGGGGPYFIWRSTDGGKTWDKSRRCAPKNFASQYGFFGGETWLWQARSGKIWALVRVDSTEMPIRGRPITAQNDQADHFILFSSGDEGLTFDRIRDIGDYGEMYLSLLRLRDQRLLLTFTVRDLKPPLGVRALVGRESYDGFDFDFADDQIPVDTRTPVGKAQGGGFGPTVQLADGTLVTSYSYRGDDDRTHLEVARWHLPADVGLRKQLLVDDTVIERTSGVTRELGPVRKANGGKPIFRDGWFYGTVLHHEDRFKLWYRLPANRGYGYAESEDGLRFTKKALVEGIPFAGDYTLAVEIDPHTTDPRRRFLASFDAPGMAAGIATSGDGIHWTALNGGKPVTSRAADTYNQVLWDPIGGTYRLFTRTDFGSAGGDGEVRGTRIMTNPDIAADPTRWRLVRQWIFDREGKAEADRRQIYATTAWIYEGLYFALLSVYEHPGDLSEGTATDLKRRHERDVMNTYLATSRDGDNWDFTWVYAGNALIPRGPDGAFDKDLLLAASTIVTHGDRHWLYYGGANERHGTGAVRFERSHAIGVATLPLDRFVSYTAREAKGEVVTRPFELTGGNLQVNADARLGEIRVDVLGDSGEVLASATGRGIDSLRWRPEWKSRQNLATYRGRMVRLRFTLKRASLFAFQVLQ